MSFFLQSLISQKIVVCQLLCNYQIAQFSPLIYYLETHKLVFTMIYETKVKLDTFDNEFFSGYLQQTYHVNRSFFSLLSLL